MNLNNAETWITLDQAYVKWKVEKTLWLSFKEAYKEFHQFIDYLKSKNYRIL